MNVSASAYGERLLYFLLKTSFPGGSFSMFLKGVSNEYFRVCPKTGQVFCISLKSLTEISLTNSDLGDLCKLIVKFAEENPEEFLRVLVEMFEEGNIHENILKKCVEMMIERVLKHEKLFEKASNQRSDFNPSTSAFEIVEEWIRISTMDDSYESDESDYGSDDESL